MAKPLRIEFAGALYHVTSRGDGREAVGLDDASRVLFLDVRPGRASRSTGRFMLLGASALFTTVVRVVRRPVR